MTQSPYTLQLPSISTGSTWGFTHFPHALHRSPYVPYLSDGFAPSPTVFAMLCLLLKMARDEAVALGTSATNNRQAARCHHHTPSHHCLLKCCCKQRIVADAIIPSGIIVAIHICLHSFLCIPLRYTMYVQPRNNLQICVRWTSLAHTILACW